MNTANNTEVQTRGFIAQVCYRGTSVEISCLLVVLWLCRPHFIHELIWEWKFLDHLMLIQELLLSVICDVCVNTVTIMTFLRSAFKNYNPLTSHMTRKWLFFPLSDVTIMKNWCLESPCTFLSAEQGTHNSSSSYLVSSANKIWWLN